MSNFTTRLQKAAQILSVKSAKLFLVITIFGLIILPLQPASAAVLTTSSMALSDPRPSQASVQYTFTGSSVSLSAIKCAKIVFATTASGTTVPTSMSTSSAALSGTSNYFPTPAGWTVDASTNGTVKITNATGETPASASGRTIVLTGITNGATADTNYFAQVTTYNNVDCATTPVDSATVAFIFTNGQSVSMTVDPSISFSVAGTSSGTTCNGQASTVTTTATTVPLGTITTSANAVGVQNLTVTTNAGNGYTVNARYTAKPTSGSNDIDDHSGSNAAPTAFSAAGTEAYGYTTNDATLGTGTADRFTSSGGNKWAAFTTTNAEVAYNNAAVSSQTTCVGHQSGVAGTTSAGTYTTTAIYTATPVY
jgi:hypothetical protein